MTVWVLTTEFNDYDQHGEYFIAVFADRPSIQQLQAAGVPLEWCQFVLDRGGREDTEYQWFYLRQHSI